MTTEAIVNEISALFFSGKRKATEYCVLGITHPLMFNFYGKFKGGRVGMCYSYDNEPTECPDCGGEAKLYDWLWFSCSDGMFNPNNLEISDGRFKVAKCSVCECRYLLHGPRFFSSSMYMKIKTNHCFEFIDNFTYHYKRYESIGDKIKELEDKLSSLKYRVIGFFLKANKIQNVLEKLRNRQQKTINAFVCSNTMFMA